MPTPRRLSALVLVAACCLGADAATAAAQPGLPLPAPPPADPGPPVPDSIAGRFGAAQSCSEMSDGCRVCVRGSDGHPTCSMPGIACVPRDWRCRSDTGERKLRAGDPASR